ncbi:hypothetical protein SteCoe_30429 [Stentor coeruleus]|uniref:Uncharacterized protein n=1 Tax=Stentor coeruleus TaxID=5963 RepID=A0A1R2B439_9CILI|nr:hypothetical protein SteCoe_30429 [Stentor coeruleus]
MRALYVNVDTSKSYENLSGKSSSLICGISVRNKKLSKLVEEAFLVKKKKCQEEKKRNRMKLTLELHQQLEIELNVSARIIQKHIRGYLARKYVREMLIEKYRYENYLLEMQQKIGEYWEVDYCIKHIAAYRIQRYWKGFRKYPVKIDLVQRYMKMVRVMIEFEKTRKYRQDEKMKLGLIEKYIKIKIGIHLQFLCRCWESFRNYEKSRKNSEVTIESSVSKTSEESEINEESEESEISEKSILEKAKEPEIIKEKNSIGHAEVYNKILPLPPNDFALPKLFVLSEANFTKPTLSSQGKNADYCGLPPIKPFKINKAKVVKLKKLTNQTSGKITYVKEKTMEVKQKIEQNMDIKSKIEQTKVGVSSEVKIPRSSLPKKYSYIQSKINELKDRSTRSSSTGPLHKNHSEKEECLNKTKQDLILPSLGFKQALPDLYQFVESYGQTIKKNDSVKTASGLIILTALRK